MRSRRSGPPAPRSASRRSASCASVSACRRPASSSPPASRSGSRSTPSSSSGNADMFGIMKLVQNVENGKSENEFKLTARRVLELGTIEGARSMGIDDKVGSLKPGKRADLIMVSTRDINLGVFGDPAHMIVTAAQPVERRHRGDRRPHPQARRQAHGTERCADRRRSRRRQRGAAQARGVVVSGGWRRSAFGHDEIEVASWRRRRSTTAARHRHKNEIGRLS